MYRVIDTIEHRATWTFRYPELARRGDGVLVVLDPEQINTPPDLAGLEIEITRPNGEVARHVADSAEAPAGVVGVLFKGLDAAQIPRGSTLRW